MILLFLDAIEIPGYITLIISTLAAIAGFFVGYVYLKTGIENKKAEGYKSLYEMEEKRTEKLQKELERGSKELLKAQNDFETLANEFSQLSELYAKKSIILEALTSQYGGVAETIKKLQNEGKLSAPKLLESKAPINNGG